MGIILFNLTIVSTLVFFIKGVDPTEYLLLIFTCLRLLFYTMQENLSWLKVFLKGNELDSSDKRQKNSVTNVTLNPLYYSKRTLYYQGIIGFK
jgi:hypothetical protein